MDHDRARLRDAGRAPTCLQASISSPPPGLHPLSTPAASRLTLICQGATTATRAAAFPVEDDPLDPASIAVLPRLRARLGWRDHAFASPSRAACDTAAALGTTVVVASGLRDCDHGAWTGRPMADVASDDPDGFAGWLRDPESTPHGGESLSDVLDRVRSWLDACAEEPKTRLAVVSPFVVRALAVAALDLPAPVFWRLDATPLGVSQLTAQDGRWRLATFNATL